MAVAGSRGAAVGVGVLDDDDDIRAFAEKGDGSSLRVDRWLAIVTSLWL